MDSKEAFICHTAWKTKLARYLNNPDGSLDASMVESPDQCDLGAWIHDAAKKYASVPEFAALVAAHERLHIVAGEIVRRANSGQDVKGEIALGAKSEFAQASAAVVNSIMSLASKL